MRFFRIISAYGWNEITYAVYAYRPESLRSLWRLMAHEVYGQTARFQRFAASMLYAIAGGRKIDLDRTEPFGRQIEDIYRNPFRRRGVGLQTRKEIEEYIIRRLTE